MFAQMIPTPYKPESCPLGSERLAQHFAKDFPINVTEEMLFFQLSVYLHLDQNFTTCLYNFENSFYVLGSITVFKLFVTTSSNKFRPDSSIVCGNQSIVEALKRQDSQKRGQK
jgi:hypothetical protein